MNVTGLYNKIEQQRPELKFRPLLFSVGTALLDRKMIYLCCVW